MAAPNTAEYDRIDYGGLPVKSRRFHLIFSRGVKVTCAVKEEVRPQRIVWTR
jgi:hypothetical protein